MVGTEFRLLIDWLKSFRVICSLRNSPICRWFTEKYNIIIAHSAKKYFSYLVKSKSNWFFFDTISILICLKWNNLMRI